MTNVPGTFWSGWFIYFREAARLLPMAVVTGEEEEEENGGGQDGSQCRAGVGSAQRPQQPREPARPRVIIKRGRARPRDQKRPNKTDSAHFPSEGCLTVPEKT